MNSLQVQIQNFVDALVQPVGLIGLCLFIFVIVGLLAFPHLKWWILAFLMFVASLAYSGVGGLHLLQPLDTFRLYSRPIVTLMLAVLLIPLFRSGRGWRLRLVLPGLMIFYGFQLLVSVRFLVWDHDFFRGYFGILSYSVIFLVCGLGISRWLQSLDDARSVIRAIVLAGIAFSVAGAAQYFVDPSAVSWSGRFLGVSGNANHAGVILGLAIPPTVFEVITSRRRLLWRIALGSVVALMVVLLVWTGSRTGFVTGLVGTVLLFRLRVGRLALALIVCGAFVYLMLSVFVEAQANASRLIAFDDTRSVQWRSMIGDFLQHPLFGISAQESRWSENSYLLIAARTGLLGLLPFAVAMVLVVLAILQLQRLRKVLGSEALLADLVTGGLLSVGTGAMLEGFLLGTYSFPIFTMMIYLALLAFLVDYCQALQRQQLEEGQWQHEEAYEAPDLDQHQPYIPAPQEQWT
jgi:hypothetical protein